MKSTNYTSTFITTAEDCKATKGIVPPTRDSKQTVASLVYEIISSHPYRFTSDDVIFTVYAERQKIPQIVQRAARTEFFSKGQPCFRTSALSKTYGWGFHHDVEGRVAIYGCESKEYSQLLSNDKVVKVNAMRNKKTTRQFKADTDSGEIK